MKVLFRDVRHGPKDVFEIFKGFDAYRYTTGWLGYYSIADMGYIMKDISELTKRRIRQIYWKQWKRISAKEYNLVKLGIDKSHAWQWANSRLGYWRIAGSWILSRSLTNKYLASQHKDMMTSPRDTRQCAYFTEPPYTERCVRWCERTAAQIMGSLLLDLCA